MPPALVVLVIRFWCPRELLPCQLEISLYALLERRLYPGGARHRISPLLEGYQSEHGAVT